MDKQQVIDWYMDKFADKEPTVWCRVLWRYYNPGSLIYMSVSDVISTLKWWPIHSLRVDVKNYLDFEAQRTDAIESDEFHERYEVIWHPLTRGRLYLCLSYRDNTWFSYDLVEKALKIVLIKWKVLDKTIYERVEYEEVLDVLIAIKSLYEDKGAD